MGFVATVNVCQASQAIQVCCRKKETETTCGIQTGVIVKILHRQLDRDELGAVEPAGDDGRDDADQLDDGPEAGEELTPPEAATGAQRRHGVEDGVGDEGELEQQAEERAAAHVAVHAQRGDARLRQRAAGARQLQQLRPEVENRWMVRPLGLCSL